MKISLTTVKVLKPNKETDGVIKYDITTGNANVTQNYLDNDDSPDIYSNAGGFLKNVFSGSKERNARRNARVASKSEGRKLRAGAKNILAKSQQIASQNLGKESQSDIAIAKALASKTSKASKATKKGMSTGVKVAIAGGILLVLVGGFFLVKKMKKK